jgi:hypothetical protein
VNKKLSNLEKLIGFLGSLFLFILMLLVADEHLKTGFWYYLLLSILSIAITSYSILYVLKNLIKGLEFLCLQTNIFIAYLTKKLNNLSFPSLPIMLLVTFGWLVFITFLILMQKGDYDFSCLLNIKLDGLSLNEWGDFLAGFIAPVALGWLAYSIYYQKKEFENVHSSLKDQVAELEIEKHYTNYEQYVNKIDILINSVNSQMNTLSFEELNKNFTLVNPNDYLNISTKIKKIFLLNKSLLEILQNHKNHEKSKLALKELTQQYDMIYLEDMNLINEMILKYYFLIAISDKEIKHELTYENFSKLDFWIDEGKKEKIIEIINQIEGETLFYKKIDPAFSNITKCKELLN